MVYDLKDKVVLITGAATGIGSFVVRFLLEEGVKHVAFLDIAEAAGVALQDELNTKHGDNKVKFYKGDVTVEDQLFGVFEAVIKDQGYIDVVINNAGILNDNLHTYKKQIAVNVTALISSTLKALELMRKDEGGKGGLVINISSIAGLIQTPITPIYSATKSAVLQFTNTIGMESTFSRTGVRMVTVCFGVTDTPLVSMEKIGTIDAGLQSELEEILPQFYLQRPESAARGVVDACKHGESGSSWLVVNDKPALDITQTLNNAFATMEKIIAEV